MITFKIEIVDDYIQKMLNIISVLGKSKPSSLSYCLARKNGLLLLSLTKNRDLSLTNLVELIRFLVSKIDLLLAKKENINILSLDNQDFEHFTIAAELF